MQTDISLPAAISGKTSACLDGLQMLSGAALILFMWCHMLLVGSVIIGPSVFDGVAGFLEATYMAQLGGPLIVLVFLTHFLLGLRKIPVSSREQKDIWNQARMLRHKDTWLWVVQAVSALAILVMGSAHLWVILTDLPITAAKSAARIQGGFWCGFYLLLLPLAELHVGVGFYRIGVKWGFIGRGARKGFQKIEYALTGAFILIGLSALLKFLFLSI